MNEELGWQWRRCIWTHRDTILLVGIWVLKENWEPFVVILRGLSPRANYSNRATAACRRSQCQLLWIENAAWSARLIPYGRILGFLTQIRYVFFQVAPQFYSQGWVDPVPDPLILRKSGSAGNWTRDLWICSQELWPLDHRCGLRRYTQPKNAPLNKPARFYKFILRSENMGVGISVVE
jgi:hypothetical protein